MTPFEKYFKSLRSFKISEITEHSHRKDLQELLEVYVGPKMKILHEPKRDGKLGSPDFKIIQTESIVGYVENKKIEENLDNIVKSDQLKKYQQLSDNILLTNYIEWIWIREGKTVQTVQFCTFDDIKNKKAALDPDKAIALEKLLKYFFSQAPKKIGDVKKLAEALAIRAKYLKDFLLVELQRQEKEHTEGRLYQLYETFKTHVFNELTVAEFADAFAQNLVYGLFLAKLNADTQLVNLYNAKKFIPSSFELIKELVNFLDELDNEEYRETRWIVEEVLTIMNNLDLPAIHESLSFTKKRKDKDDLLVKDPYVYFYEDFLAAYDKKLRKAKGVYYTPPPVVNFIVRAIDDILVNTFNIKEGLADRNKVTVLDFATGTGTFLVEVLQQIFDKLPKDSGKKDILIKEHILKNLYGFEYLIAPYTIAHLKLSQFLKDNGYELKQKERLQIYLTNTLEPIEKQIKISLLPALTEESKLAQNVKDKPILVITGNPPYSYVSKNNGVWITDKIKDYYFVDDKSLGEKNPKGLQDDYVKFIRFAQDKMDNVEEGIVGIITNHAFLDNPTFRGMRQSLMKTFDQMYFLDLHGNSQRKEKTPDGKPDENVFDIKQGAAISVFVKKKGIEKNISHLNIWGKREEKYKFCAAESVNNFNSKTITPLPPFYLFIPQNIKGWNKFEKGWSITDIFKIQSMGVTTANDELFIDFEIETLIKKTKKEFNEITTEYIRKYAYRPFDNRFLYNHLKLIERARENVMKHLAIQQNGKSDNIALITLRRTRLQAEWNFSFVSNCITDKSLISSLDNSNVFPLYLYNNIDERGNIEENILHDSAMRYKTENFTKDFREFINKQYNYRPETKTIFTYIYAILHSPTYRKKYGEFLKIDFPRIPFTEDVKLFKQIAKLGSELIDVHLLDKQLRYSNGHFMGKGNNVVGKPNFVLDKKKGKLYINKTQYFDNVPQEVYEFCIGGYQVLDKYLKDRKGRELGGDEIYNVENIVKSLIFTINQMQKIDVLTKKWI